MGVKGSKHAPRVCERDGCSESYLPTSGVQRYCPKHPYHPTPKKKGKGMCKGSRRVYAPRVCDNPECKTDYVPTSAGQRYCSSVVCKRYRNQVLSKRFRSTPVGKKCRWCGRGDDETVFRTDAECANCNSMGLANGYCPGLLKDRCRRGPMRKTTNGPAYCPTCNPPAVPSNYVKVRLACGGVFKISHKSPFTDVHWRKTTSTIELLQRRAGNRLLTFLVDKRSFMFGHVKNPIAVLGGDAPEWPYGLALMPDNVLGDMYDICHFIQLGEADPMTFEWYWQKYKEGASHNTASRAWERLKKRLREFGVPFTLVFSESGDSEPGVKGTMAVQFPPDFISAVRSAIRSREGP